MMNFPRLSTDRLILRQLQESDKEALFSYFKLDSVTKYYDLASFTSVQQATDLIELWTQRFANKTAIRWAIVLKEGGDDRVIGTCGFHSISIEHNRAEVGYELNPDYWQKGIMSEAIQGILSYGFETLKYHRIEAFIDPDNIASEKLLTKVGLEVEGVLRDYFFEKGVFVDAKILSIIRR